MFNINTFSTCFGHHYAHLQENKTCVTARGVLRWFCWMWSHNRYQPHPAEPAQHTTCSNTRLVLRKMGIMMPEICWESVDNKHLTVASCSFSLSLHKKFHSSVNIHSLYMLEQVVHTHTTGLQTAKWRYGQDGKCFPISGVRCPIPSGYVTSFLFGGSGTSGLHIPHRNRTVTQVTERKLQTEE